MYETFHIACKEAKSTEVKVIALDCLAKLFTFTYLEDEDIVGPSDASAASSFQEPMVDSAVKTVCDCFNSSGTDHKIELQIVKALVAAVLNDELIIHGATLLKAIRQVYTIFVVSSFPSNQTIAQAALSQMINVIFERVKGLMKKSSTTPMTPSTPSLNSGAFSSTSLSSGANRSASNSTLPEHTKLTLQQMESRGSGDQADDDIGDDLDNDLFVKDAFLVFRTLCKLTEKSLEYQVLDIKSHGLRSKLLSLHLIHTILKSHMTIFLSDDIVIASQQKGQETFLTSVKDYICSSLAKNAASISPPVFEISTEIFWLIISNLRAQFKKEIEVFFAEIYFPITEMKTSTSHQKQYFLSILQKLSNDPRALVETYLNYDCDQHSGINIYEKIIDFLVRLSVSTVHLTPVQQQRYAEEKHHSIAVYNISQPPASAIAALASQPQNDNSYPFDYALKLTALESLTSALRSLLSWSHRRIAATTESLFKNGQRATSVASTAAEEDPQTPILVSDDPDQFESLKIKKTALLEAVRRFNSNPKKGIKAFLESELIEDESPTSIAKLLLNTEGLDKSVIGEFLGEHKPENIEIMHKFVDLMDFTNLPFVDALRIFLQSFRLPGEAQKIDRFMLKFAERYITGNPNVFANAETAYVLGYSVLMLNTDQHSSHIKVRMTPEDFIKNNRGINDSKNLPEEFLREVFETIQNDEIKLLSEQHAALLASNGAQTRSGLAGLAISFSNGGRDLQREAYVQASKEMSNKTEKLFKDLTAEGKRRGGESAFFVASRIEHVKPMFEVAWMSILAGLSGPFQQSDEQDIVKLCMEGFKYAIHIACLFDNDLARISFISALAQFTNLQNVNELRPKNVRAIKQLLESALVEGDRLKTSWKEVLTSISQLERFQLISSGIEAGVIPDVTNARIASRSSTDSRSARSSITRGMLGGFGRKSMQQNPGTAHANSNAAASRQSVYATQIAEELQSSEVIILMDKIFTKSSSLSGDGIVDMVKALTEVSWEEIQSSGLSENPRTFSLQKMVDVSYYNMERVRFEWSQIWALMGKSFDQVGCHKNTSVAFFALDSLRQLSSRFFDLDELSFFMFQKDFLEPFEYIMAHSENVQVKDMALQCLGQMVQAKPDRLKSGWKTIFNTFAVAAKMPYGSLVDETLNLVKKISDNYFEQVILQESFGHMMTCLGEICKNPKFQKPSLHSLDVLKNIITRIIPFTDASSIASGTSPEATAATVNELYVKYWFPVLFSFQDVIMNGEDLEVRSRALNFLFDTLVEHGSKFPDAFWDTVCRQLLFPIFVILKTRSETAHFNTQDDMSVWLSTTMIQALRNMIALLSHYFHTLSRMLDGFLDLLVTCILQENETVSRIGSSCLQQLIEQNVDKLTPAHWNQIVEKIEHLFSWTTATELFAGFASSDSDSEDFNSPTKQNGNNGSLTPLRTPKALKSPLISKAFGSFSATSVQADSNGSDSSFRPDSRIATPKSHQGHTRVASHASWVEVNQEKQRKFRKAIVKCILQLLMIDLVQEILEKPEHENGNDEVALEDELAPIKLQGTEIYSKIPTTELLRLVALLRDSYIFSRDFNEDKELRTNLWKQGFMKQLPNLLKQETISAHVYISVMFRFYTDPAKISATDDTLATPIPVLLDEVNEQELATPKELKSYLDDLLFPLCVEILTRYSQLDEKTDVRNIVAWTPVAQSILEGFALLPKQDYARLALKLYPVMLEVLNRDLTPGMRNALKNALKRITDCGFKGKQTSYSRT